MSGGSGMPEHGWAYLNGCSGFEWCFHVRPRCSWKMNWSHVEAEREKCGACSMFSFGPFRVAQIRTPIYLSFYNLSFYARGIFFIEKCQNRDSSFRETVEHFPAGKKRQKQRKKLKFQNHIVVRALCRFCHTKHLGEKFTRGKEFTEAIKDWKKEMKHRRNREKMT